MKLSTSDFRFWGFWIKRAQTSELCNPAEDTKRESVSQMGFFSSLSCVSTLEP